MPRALLATKGVLGDVRVTYWGCQLDVWLAGASRMAAFGAIICVSIIGALVVLPACKVSMVVLQCRLGGHALLLRLPT